MTTSDRSIAPLCGHTPLAYTTRCGIPEVVHFGSAVYSDGDNVIDSLGDASVWVPLRSTAKPFFLAALLGSVLHDQRFTTAELALMSSSHNGEPRHVALVEALISRYDISASAFRCGVHPPYRPESARSVLGNNCSGKHALMLIACRVGGWPLDSYLEPTSNLQSLLRSEILARIGPHSMRDGIDGCSLPTFAVPLDALAAAYARFASDRFNKWYHDVRMAHVADAFFLGGTDRFESHIVATYGLTAKSGADGVWAVGLPSLRCALAVKISDGAEAIAQLVVLHSLINLGLIDLQRDHYLRQYSCRELYNWSGVPFGRLCTCYPAFPKT